LSAAQRHLSVSPLTPWPPAPTPSQMLTCYGDLSRNRKVGMRLGRGERLEDILASSSQARGVWGAVGGWWWELGVRACVRACARGSGSACLCETRAPVWACAS
jgi:hypothetical protein